MDRKGRISIEQVTAGPRLANTYIKWVSYLLEYVIKGSMPLYYLFLLTAIHHFNKQL